MGKPEEPEDHSWDLLIPLFLLTVVVVGTIITFTVPVPSPPTIMSLVPMISTDFPDPALWNINSTWYAFGTQSIHDSKDVHIQLATYDNNNDREQWDLHQNYDVMPSLPEWTVQDNPHVWAPHVEQLPDQSFVMYYSATLANDTNLHCLGTATSRTIAGPFTPTNASQPWACPESEGGAIDAATFLDNTPLDPSKFNTTSSTDTSSSNPHYIVYKVDGNSVRRPTPLLLQPVSPTDGITPIGSPKTLLTNDPELDGSLIEAPNIIKSAEGKYFLFYSSGHYNDATYDMKYAVSEDGVAGTYLRMGPVLKTQWARKSAQNSDVEENAAKTQMSRVFGPGGATALFETSGKQVAQGDEDVLQVVVHGYDGEEGVKKGVRDMWSLRMKLDGREVVVLE